MQALNSGTPPILRLLQSLVCITSAWEEKEKGGENSLLDVLPRYRLRPAVLVADNSPHRYENMLDSVNSKSQHTGKHLIKSSPLE